MTPLLASYIVQAAGALFTAILFGALARTYRKAFLLHWARAFAAMCVMLFGAGLTIGLSSFNPTSLGRLTISGFTSIAGYVQVAWLMLGAAYVVSDEMGERIFAARKWIFSVSIFLSIGLVALFANDPDPVGIRLVLRTGLRSLFIGFAFLAAAIAVMRAPSVRSRGGFGRTTVAIALAAFGGMQVHLAWTAFFQRELLNTNYGIYTGIADFVLTFAVGLGVVIWLLEEEHTKAQDTTREVAQLAFHDPLTGLPNRKLLLDHLSLNILQARRDRAQLAVFFLDLDRFKFINDSLGHSVGDKVLTTVSGRIKAAMREADSVGRMGGDEFVIVAPSVRNVPDAVHIAQKVKDAISVPIHTDGRELFVSSSIGIAIYPDDGNDAETLLKNADAAMYRAKAQGNDLFQLYTAEMNAHASEQLQLEAALRRAVEAKEFELHYQPIVLLDNNQICALETMLRWRHPVLGLVRPEQFIRLAESTGLIVPIGEWAMRTACMQLAEWRKTGHQELRLALNISIRQLKQQDFVDNVRVILAETGVPGSAVEFEITEMGATQSETAIVDRLRMLRTLGVKISIDDFGTGYTSVSVLKHFPVDSLKIDTSFIRDLVLDPNDAAIAGAVVALAKSMGLTVIAEGVENPAQLDFLREQGCEMWQGYLCCPPVQSSEVPSVLGRRTSGNIRRFSGGMDVVPAKH